MVSFCWASIELTLDGEFAIVNITGVMVSVVNLTECRISWELDLGGMLVWIILIRLKEQGHPLNRMALFPRSGPDCVSGERW